MKNKPEKKYVKPRIKTEVFITKLSNVRFIRDSMEGFNQLLACDPGCASGCGSACGC